MRPQLLVVKKLFLSVGRGTGICFAVLLALTLVAFAEPLTKLIALSWEHEHQSHIVLIPLISASLIVSGRSRIFSEIASFSRSGLALLVAGTMFYLFGLKLSASANETSRLSIAIFAAVVVCVGAFVTCYGLHAFRKSRFALLFLFLMIPLPDLLLDHAIAWLQIASTEVSHLIFQLLGVPVYRTDFILSLPGVTIEVAKECSGIRSSIALLITGLLAGHLFLRTAAAKVILLMAALPLLILKNGVRIVTLSLLSIYIDPGFLTGDLHRRGGVLFFLLTLAILLVVVRLLQKWEHANAARRGAATIAPSERRQEQLILNSDDR